ncbi:hypothetical protein MRX96_057808 [Rhipicephalus microplus]
MIVHPTASVMNVSPIWAETGCNFVRTSASFVDSTADERCGSTVGVSCEASRSPLLLLQNLKLLHCDVMGRLVRKARPVVVQGAVILWD